MHPLLGLPEPRLFGETLGTLAVRIFFILSGYLICQSYSHDSNCFRYFIRRIFRIFPGLIFVVAISAFVLGPLLTSLSPSDYFRSFDTFFYLMNVLLYPVYNLPGVFEGNFSPAVNGSLWTLPIEFSMYLLLPLCFIVLKKLGVVSQGFLLLALAALAVRLGLVIFFPSSAFWLFWGTPWTTGFYHFPYFFMGAFFATKHCEKKCNLQIALFLTATLAILKFDILWINEIIMFLALPYIVIAISYATPAVFGKVFAINDYSYGMYLWAFVVQQIAINVLGGLSFAGPIAYTPICLCVTFACAIVSWHMIEKPSMALGKQITTWSRKRTHRPIALRN